jgi:DNA-binding CsgD family transcriptional regulator
MDEDLLALIYESAFEPALWTKVLDSLSDVAGARGGALYYPNSEGLRWMASEGLKELVAEYVAGGWVGRGRRRARIRAARQNGFVGERELFSQDELDADPIYRDFLRPRGYGWGAATLLPVASGANVTLGLERDYARGPVEPSTLRRLNELHPHLARSALVASRLQWERARVASETLAVIGLPAAVVDRQRRALAVNHLAEALSDFVQLRAKDQLGLKDKTADALLRKALADVTSTNPGAACAFPARSEANGLMVVNVVPVTGMARDVFAAGVALVLFSPLQEARTPPVELLITLFRLTPKEVRVAHGLAAGATLDELAAIGNVSLNTVRSQLRVVLEKTGCARQAELVLLLSRVRLGL